MSDTTLSLTDYLPHRSPMLLLSRIISVAESAASAEVDVTAKSAFYIADKGVPAWIGLEYMGQTAALIAGYQKHHRQLAPHMGFLLGTRRYQSHSPWFTMGSQLQIVCEQAAVVGESLATFDCQIRESDQTIASARLSVFRKPISE